MFSVIKSRTTKILVILTVIGIITLIALEYKDKAVTGTAVNILQNAEEAKISYEVNSQADFYTYSKYIYYCTKDGMQILNLKGEQIQNDTFTMTSPYMSYDGRIVGVSEKLGNTVNVYDEKGKLYSVNTKLPITSFSVNKGGFVSIIIKDEEKNVHYIEVYNISGNKISTTMVPIEDGIPIASDVSDDNRILGVSVIDISDIQMKSRVMFYYIYAEQSSTVESSGDLFASFIKENQIVAILKFMNNNNVVAVSDMEICFVEVGNSVGNSVENKHSEKGSIQLKNKLDSIDFLENKYIVVAYGDSFINAKQPEEKGVVKWYNLSGSQINEFKTNKTVTGLYSGYGASIIGMNRNFKAVSNKGGLIWEYNAIQDVKKILFLDNTDNVLLVTNHEAIIINIKKKIIGDKDIETISETSTEVSSTETTTIKASETQTVNTTEITSERVTSKNKKEDKKETTTKALKKENETKKPTTEKTIEKTTEKSTEKSTVEEITEKEATEKQSNNTEVTTKKKEEAEQTTKEPQKQPESEPDLGPVMPEDES